MKNRNLRFPVGTAAGKRRFLLFTGLFPQLSADKFQHTARDAAGLIRNEKTVGKFLFAGVYIGHLKTGRYRITAAQKSAQNARDLRGHRNHGTICRADLRNGLTRFHDISNFAEIHKYTGRAAWITRSLA